MNRNDMSVQGRMYEITSITDVREEGMAYKNTMGRGVSLQSIYFLSIPQNAGIFLPLLVRGQSPPSVVFIIIIYFRYNLFFELLLFFFFFCGRKTLAWCKC